MGNHNSGRRPQPTALKLLRGNPGKRPINRTEPRPPAAEASFDTPPPELAGDGRAIAEWRRLAPMLRECGLISHAERTALVALCQQWSRYLEAQAKVRRLGLLTKAGVNPYLSIADKALAQCQRLWIELGLTPSSRARVHRLPAPSATPAAPVSKWQGFL